MGQGRRIDDDEIWRRRDTQFSVPRVHCPKERSKAKVVENCQYTFAVTTERLKLFFAHLFLFYQLSIYGSLSDLCEEYKACYVRTERRDLYWQDNPDPLFVPTSSLMKKPTLSTDDPSQGDLLQKVPRTSGKAITARSSDKDLYGCRILDNG